MTPCPVELSFWFRTANIPAKIGAAKLVPPAVVSLALFTSRNPCEQLPVMPVFESLEHNRYGALTFEELREMSGVKRNVPEGIPGTPVCHVGLGVSVLTPPPPDASPPVARSSFHTRSGMYLIAELTRSTVLLVAGSQNELALAPDTSTERNSLPPTAVTYWLSAGKSTANPVLGPQSVEPESPEATITDWPCEAACAKVVLFSIEYSVELRLVSHFP